VDVRASLGALELFLVDDELLFGSLVELDVLGLWRATTPAGLFWTWVPILTLRTGPFQFYKTKRLFDHGSLSSLLFSVPRFLTKPRC
jgi:hypothetical protein